MAAIHNAILAIQTDMPQLEKNGIGPQTQGSYKFLSVDDILKATKPLLDKHKVIVHAELLDHGFHYNRANPKDNERVPKEAVQAFVKYAFHFIATEDGSEIVTTVLGEGIDSQDKAIRKATTSAWKIALIQTFSLVTGEIDPDAQDGAAAAQDSAPQTAPAQAKLAKASGSTAKSPAGKVNDLDAVRTAIKNKSQAIKEATGTTVDYLAVGDHLTGQDANARTWHTDLASLNRVLDALNNGVVE